MNTNIENFIKKDTKYKHYNEQDLRNKFNYYKPYEELIWKLYPTEKELENNELNDDFKFLLNCWSYNTCHVKFCTNESNIDEESYSIVIPVLCDDFTAVSMYGKKYNPIDFNIAINNNISKNTCTLSSNLESIYDHSYFWTMYDISIEKALNIISEQICYIENLKINNQEFSPIKWQIDVLQKYNINVEDE